MRDPKRIDVILQQISNIWHKYPDMRLGQLIGNVLEGANLYYVEDDGLVAALKDMYENAQENVSFDSESYIWDLVKKHPGELCFILQAKTYKDYIATYTDVGGSAEEAVYNEHEFGALKDFFGDEE
jgi:hypothetical protein